MPIYKVKCPYCIRRYRSASSLAYYKHVRHTHSHEKARDQAKHQIRETRSLPTRSPSLRTREYNIVPPNEHPENQQQSSESEAEDDSLENSIVGSPNLENSDSESNDSPKDNQEAIPENLTPEYHNEMYKYAGQPVREGKPPFWDRLRDQPLYPFVSERDYKLARWFVRSKTPKGRIDDYFNEGLHQGTSESGSLSFQSAHTMWKQLDRMEGHLPGYETGTVEVDGRRIPFLRRDIVEAAQYLMGQPCYREYQRYAPVHQYSSDGERQYNEMHTGDWWWEIQQKLPVGATVVPLIVSSDETHLTNFSGTYLRC
jgi:hypothetical protein